MRSPRAIAGEKIFIELNFFFYKKRYIVAIIKIWKNIMWRTEINSKYSLCKNFYKIRWAIATFKKQTIILPLFNNFLKTFRRKNGIRIITISAWPNRFFTTVSKIRSLIFEKLYDIQFFKLTSSITTPEHNKSIRMKIIQPFTKQNMRQTIVIRCFKQLNRCDIYK